MSDQTEDAPHRQQGAISTAMKNADRQIEAEKEAGGAVADALKDGAVSRPSYRGHTHATNTVLAAQQMQLTEKLGDLDARIAELNEERDDVLDALDEVESVRTRIAERVKKRPR